MSVDPFSSPLSSQPTNFEISTSAQGGSNIPANLFSTSDNILPQTTTFIPRLNNPDPSPTPLLTAGIPGSNFIGGDQATPVFYQGEDIIYDSYLYINGQSFSLTDYTLNAIVKPSQYFMTPYWTGILGNGIYQDSSNGDHYVIFIPNTITSTLIAGTLELDIWAVQSVGNNINIKPRTLLVGKTYFNVEYAAFSPNPETIETGSPNRRASLQNTYPPPFNTVSDGSNSDNCQIRLPAV